MTRHEYRIKVEGSLCASLVWGDGPIDAIRRFKRKQPFASVVSVERMEGYPIR